MNQGYIALYRKLLDWEWYDHMPTFKLFIHCLLKANYKDKKWRGFTIKKGQFATSYSKLSIETGLSLQTVRTCIKNLEDSGELTCQSTNRNSIITVNRYDCYQANQHTDNNQLTNDQQSTNKQLTTTNKENNNNKENNINKRIDNFYLEVFKHSNKYPNAMLQDFFEYWTEHGENDIKLRFEKEKTFGLSRRLSTWHKRSENYNKPKKTYDPTREVRI